MTLQWMLIVLKHTIFKVFWNVYIPFLWITFLNPSNEAIGFSTSKLSAPCLISILDFIVFLSGSIITLPSVSSFINSAMSVKSYALGVIIEYNNEIPL